MKSKHDSVCYTSSRSTQPLTLHSQICGSVRFIPSRPSEVVSGGYDSTLLHFDTAQRSVSSRHKIGTRLAVLLNTTLIISTVAPEPSAGVSLSPPFVLSLAVSPSGLVAAGLADGRVWLGAGGDRNAPGSQKKRVRKWEGLRDADVSVLQIAEGPVVAVYVLFIRTVEKEANQELLVAHSSTQRPSSLAPSSEGWHCTLCHTTTKAQSSYKRDGTHKRRTSRRLTLWP